MKKLCFSLAVVAVLLLCAAGIFHRYNQRHSRLQRQLISDLQQKVVKSHWQVILRQEQSLDDGPATSGSSRSAERTRLHFAHPKLDCIAAHRSWTQAILPDFARELEPDCLPEITIEELGVQTNVVFTWRTSSPTSH